MFVQQFNRTHSFAPSRFQAAPQNFQAPMSFQAPSALAETVMALQQLFHGFNSFLQPSSDMVSQAVEKVAAPSAEWLEKAAEMMHAVPPSTEIKAPRNEWLEAASDKMQILPRNLASTSAEALKVAVIDDFVAEDNGFNHGEMVASTIENGGALLGKDVSVQTLRFNVDQPGQDRTELISRSLDEILLKIRNGEEINAVNLSQQAFTQTETTRRINSQVDQLEELGVAVVVAAGNEPGKVNELARSADIVVENADADGKRAATSGRGNVRVEGGSTSKAAANFSPVAAFRQAQSRKPRSAALAAATTAFGPEHR